MKHLTPIYLTLMHAFRDAADRRLNNPNYSFYEPSCLMREYGTLRLDGGRQTGKTAAFCQFATDWLLEDGSVIILSTRYTQSSELMEGILREYNSSHLINKLPANEIAKSIVPMTIREFLSNDSSYKFRGRKFGRALIIIEEPMKVPDMMKFYDMYQEAIRWSMPNDTLPLFFVIGMQ